jgi:NAD(P)-dependent dehydrogenase (short-subunit alcohol dehydrogenase family)
MTGVLDGRVAIVTGGASGLGAAIVDRFRTEGATVVVADLDAPEPVDVTSDADVAGLVARVVAEHGRLDVLVCSAAVEVRARLGDTTDDDWQHILDVNLKGPFLCLKHALPEMVRGGGGSAVLLGSVLGAIGAPQYSAYCASKAALVNLAKQAAIEHAPDAVRVNVLSPSACDAGLFASVAEATGDAASIKAFVASSNPMGRLGTADEVASAALFLASDASTYTSGTVLPLDGAMAARRSP